MNRVDRVHKPVLLQEVIAGLDPQVGETVLDATVNRGGHSLALGQCLGPDGLLIGLDADQSALSEAKQALASCPCRVELLHRNFRHLEMALDELGVSRVHKALFDLGLSSNQLESSGRGFSFMREEPLLMTFDARPEMGQTVTAYEIVNRWGEERIAGILFDYGEERFARRIATAIVRERRRGPIKTTSELVSAIEGAVPKWYQGKRLHFATRSFQALRMAVNDEMGALGEGFSAAWGRLASGGRLAVISFHSLEARLVKNFFRDCKSAGAGHLLTKHAIKPTREEILQNPRARSAELRLIQKI